MAVRCALGWVGPLDGLAVALDDFDLPSVSAAGASGGSDNWTCGTCTFINSPGDDLCSVCRTARAGLDSDIWQCKACTFVNAVGITACEMCGTNSESGKPSGVFRGACTNGQCGMLALGMPACAVYATQPNGTCSYCGCEERAHELQASARTLVRCGHTG